MPAWFAPSESPECRITTRPRYFRRIAEFNSRPTFLSQRLSPTPARPATSVCQHFSLRRSTLTIRVQPELSQMGPTRTSCASKATLRCRNSPQISPCTLGLDPCGPQLFTPTIDTQLHDWTWFQVSNFDSSRRLSLPIGLRRENSLRLDLTSSLNGRSPD